MEKMKVYYDPLGNTLHIWFGDPRDEYITEEADEELGLVKNKAGEIIGIKKLNFLPAGFSEKSVDRLQDRDQILGFEFDPRRYERSAAVG
ncbi:MAG: DUF2283 domain-containing protein [Candidatus Latescibacteria bacterium]|nr:DUF2283 domain-containing protein [Candidatus Latescibacterota bacterium]